MCEIMVDVNYHLITLFSTRVVHKITSFCEGSYMAVILLT